jgi:hypothetical protein
MWFSIGTIGGRLCELLGYTKFDYLAGHLLLKAVAPCSYKNFMTIFSFPVAIIVVTVVAGNSGGGSSSSAVSKSREQ